MKRILLLIPLLLLFTNFTPNKLTLKEVYTEIKNQEIKHPDIVLKQVIEETKWLKCNGCSLDKNNLLGMTKVIYPNGVKKRVFVTYKDWKDSIKAYKKWQNKWYDEERDYYEFLDCIYTGENNRCVRYATNPLYTTNLKNININEIL